MPTLTEIQTMLLRQLFEKPLLRAGRVPEFCLELEADGYVEITPTNESDLSIEITDDGRKALSDAEQFAGGAIRARRDADEYLAARGRGEVQRNSGDRAGRIPTGNSAPTVAAIGLTGKAVHEARQTRDAKKALSVSLTLAHVNSSGYENEQGVHFAMMHNHTIVRILATRTAIQGSGRMPEDGSYLGRFEAAREFFESLAKEKFDPARPLAKVTITREDLLGKVVEARTP
jgi:hypothetical protein